jgi:membrane protein
VAHFIDSWSDFRVVGSILIFAIMIWFIFISRVLILGAMLNAVYQKYKEGQLETRRGDIIEIIKDLRKDEEHKRDTKKLKIKKPD